MSPHPSGLLPDDAQDLAGKAVLVTGGTTGIGRATVRLLVREGARVLTFGRDETALAGALEEVRDGPGEVHGLTADVSRLDDVRRVFAEVDRRLGGLDVLVANAAVTGEGFEEDSLESIDQVVRTNVVGYLACAHEAVRRMKERARGHVVLVGSMSAELREEEGSTYVATKAAIQGFAESLRKTVNEQGIKVTLIEPGKVATDMVEKPEAEMEREIGKLKMLRPEDVAGVVLYALRQPERCDIVSLQIRPHRQVI
jgi:NAD(P)-dependent dehydrogenase (short-subunit alcohol dehydrogenase family)